jgi:hypothetical protein
MDKLRDEIIESEKARADFLKWKIVLAGAIGATGAGGSLARSRPATRT